MRYESSEEVLVSADAGNRVYYRRLPRAKTAIVIFYWQSESRTKYAPRLRLSSGNRRDPSGSGPPDSGGRFTAQDCPVRITSQGASESRQRPGHSDRRGVRLAPLQTGGAIPASDGWRLSGKRRRGVDAGRG